MPKAGYEQARGRVRRRELVEAAIDLFATTGSRGTGIEAVAAKAGVSRPTLLHHFKSKAGLLRAVLEERDRRAQPAWENSVGVGGMESVRRLTEIADTWLREPGMATLQIVLMAEALDEANPMHDYFVRRQSWLRKAIRTSLEKGQARGEIDPAVDCRLKAIEIACFLDGALIQWLLDPKRVPLRPVFDRYIEDLMATLAPEASA